jgi:hypothetical protein
LTDVTVASVLEFIAYPAAHLKAAVWRHRYIAAVEQAVDVTTKKEPITRFMFAVIGIRANVCRIQCRKGSLSCDGAAPGVVISDDDTKSALPKARAN